MVNFQFFDCKLAVSGPRDALAEYERLIPTDGYDYNFTFDAFSPTPKEYLNCDSDECIQKRFKWRKENWGTVADATEGQNVNISPSGINVFFGTLGDYPAMFVRRLSWRFPTLNITLSYETRGERGIMLFKRGKCEKSKFRQFE